MPVRLSEVSFHFTKHFKTMVQCRIICCSFSAVTVRAICNHMRHSHAGLHCFLKCYSNGFDATIFHFDGLRHHYREKHPAEFDLPVLDPAPHPVPRLRVLQDNANLDQEGQEQGQEEERDYMEQDEAVDRREENLARFNANMHTYASQMPILYLKGQFLRGVPTSTMFKMHNEYTQCISNIIGLWSGYLLSE